MDCDICYILSGHTPIPENDVLKWALWMDSHDRIVKQTKPCPGVLVSTVFTGVDYGYFPEHIPVLFETMIFGGRHDQFIERYYTWDEAKRGHHIIVREFFPMLITTN